MPAREAALAPFLRALFAPVPVTVGSARVDPEAYESLPDGVRLPGSPAPRRRAEYAAGRIAAHRALRAATGKGGWPGRGGLGAPVWPEGVTGSLTHSGTLAVCVVTTAAVRVGVDAEPLASAAHLHRGRHLVAGTAEERRAAAEPDPRLAVLRLFCAKEAAYKAFPPHRQPGLTFRRLTLAWDAPTCDRGRDTVTLRALEDWARPLRLAAAVRDGHMFAAATFPPAGGVRGAHPGEHT